MDKYTVYMIQCSDSSYYTGITNDVNRRMQEHNEGQNPGCYTFSRRPLSLVFQRDFHFILQAIAFEKQLKGWNRKKKEALINGDIDLLKKLSSGEFWQ